MKAIFHNDDFGLTYGFTDAIKDSFQNGVTTSTSLRTNGFAYKYAVKLSKGPLRKIGLGLHVNITQGKAHTKGEVEKFGVYKYNFRKLFLKLFVMNLLKMKQGVLLKDLEREIEAQFVIVLKKDKLKISRVDGHDHIHMIPEVFHIVCKLCKKYNIGYIRIPREPFYFTGFLKQDLKMIFSDNLLKALILTILSAVNIKIAKSYKLKTVDAYYGLLNSNNMSFLAINAALLNASRNNYDTIEINSHPAIINDPRDVNYVDNFISKYANLNTREIEHLGLKSQLVKKTIKKYKIKLTNCENII